ncbi:hypothetical protein [Stigmatella aurantiaca]|uniref:hypothetical protein n=1 Tax=Stigmatella aurantiaca TaxID=41 RepID=UPI001E2C59B1|nr:hypothetical protein [Stigmatella aurantiaca]
MHIPRTVDLQLVELEEAEFQQAERRLAREGGRQVMIDPVKANSRKPQGLSCASRPKRAASTSTLSA